MPEDPYRLLADNAIHYAIFTADTDGVIQTWSPGAERVFGYTESEVQGQQCDMLFVPEDREAGVPELERSLALHAGRAENERWHLRKDGSRFWGAGEMIPLRTPDQRHVGFGKITRDFTRRRELETAHLEAQRMEGVGLFAGGLAHLFNNLLTASLGNLDLLLGLPELRSNGEARELAASALQAGRRMAELTHQILTFAGKARRRRQPVDLSREVHEAVNKLGPEIPRNIALVVAIPESCPPVAGDATLLRQLLTSLVVNAAEAMSEQDVRGTIAVTGEECLLTTDHLRQAHSGFSLLPGRYVRLTVADTGPGLSPESQARMFDPFYSTKFQGRGLGLAAALGIVRMHGGAITARSAPAAGATFEVLLPVDGEAESRPSEGARMALVVDDEELVRSLTSRILEAEGFTVVQGENGEQAVRIAERLGSRIELVLLDLAMPEQDGAATLPALRTLLPRAPIIVMTELVASEPGDRLGHPGATTLQKPFTYTQLTEAIETALAAQAGGSSATAGPPRGS
jgi:PAS domain S-box-containing protein